MSIEAKLKTLGLNLPTVAQAVCQLCPLDHPRPMDHDFRATPHEG